MPPPAPPDHAAARLRSRAPPWRPLARFLPAWRRLAGVRGHAPSRERCILVCPRAPPRAAPSAAPRPSRASRAARRQSRAARRAEVRAGNRRSGHRRPPHTCTLRRTKSSCLAALLPAGRTAPCTRRAPPARATRARYVMGLSAGRDGETREGWRLLAAGGVAAVLWSGQGPGGSAGSGRGGGCVSAAASLQLCLLSAAAPPGAAISSHDVTRIQRRTAVGCGRGWRELGGGSGAETKHGRSMRGRGDSV